jgi:hypothetical protein
VGGWKYGTDEAPPVFGPIAIMEEEEGGLVER